MEASLSINCNGLLMDFNTPKIMGILNITPDSFYDGGKNSSINNALNLVGKMLEEGADFIDIGAISSRPGASNVSLKEERDRIIPVLKEIINSFPKAIISIDTFRSNIAEECINIGASIINDISGGDADKNMFDVIARLNCPYILMHMRGNSTNMQTKTDYNNVTIDVIKELSVKIHDLKNKNICDIIIDPGFGFSKTLEQNYQLLNELDIFKDLIDLPLLVGVSRKSMIWKLLESKPEKALNGTSALNMIALQKGAKILRVHDVKEAKELIKLHNALNLTSNH